MRPRSLLALCAVLALLGATSAYAGTARITQGDAQAELHAANVQ